MQRFHGTTIVAVNRNGVTALVGDGQVSLGDTSVKRGAVKVRSLADGKVVAGFAGAVSDAFTLLDRFEGYLETYRGRSDERRGGEEWRGRRRRSRDELG